MRRVLAWSALSALLLAGCASPRGTMVVTEIGLSSSAAAVEAPPAEAAPIAPAAPAEWIDQAPVTEGARARLRLPAECMAQSFGSLLSVICDDARFVEVRGQGTDLDVLTADTLELFSDAGAQVVTLGSPTCTVGDTSLPCEFIEASSERGVVGRAVTAVGDGFSVRCVAMDGGDVLADNICR